MKENVSSFKEDSVPVTVVEKDALPEVKEEVRSEEKMDVGEATNPSQSKKTNIRKPIRPRFSKSAVVSKKDPFEVEFTFDSNEDPFKPKVTLGSSPPKTSPSSSSCSPESDANRTLTMVISCSID